MLVLHAIPASLYSAKLRIVLRAKGLAFEERLPPGGYGSAAYRALVPSGNLPALLHDGFLIADSEAAAEYLEERFPAPALLPSGPQARARMRERGRFHDTRLEPEVRRLFPHVAPDRRDQALAARQGAAIAERLGQLARMLAAGPETDFGLGDCGFPVTFAWLDALAGPLGLGLAWPEPVAAYRARIEAAPPVAAELAAYRAALRAWLASVGAGDAG